MVLTNKRPPLILAFAGDMAGCGNHRIITPVTVLGMTGLANVIIDGRLWSIDEVRAAAPDVIVCQRFTEKAQIDFLCQVKLTMPDVFLVYEVDDILSEVPDDSWHKPFMPPEIDQRVQQALQFCNAVTTTTYYLAEWLRSLGATDVRVVPNLIPLQMVREQLERNNGKPRIGFFGGVSHAGDVRLLYKAMEATKDKADWVFFGMEPKDAPIPYEYHNGVPFQYYLDKLYSLKLDLAVAPLQDNRFNLCKSNLRLLEAGACDIPVIAQDLEPYHLDAPPVVTYCKTEGDWQSAIEDFLEKPRMLWRKDALALRNWVAQRYTFEGKGAKPRLIERIEGWLPKGLKPFRPQEPAQARKNQLPILYTKYGKGSVHLPSALKDCPTAATLEAAFGMSLASGAHILFLRPDTTLTHESWVRIKAVLQPDDSSTFDKSIGVVLPLSNDGINSFPIKDRFMPVDKYLTEQIADVLPDMFLGRRLKINVPVGPVMLISARAVSVCGMPDFHGAEGVDEIALIEWGCYGAFRGFRVMQALDAYAGTSYPPTPATPNFNNRLNLRRIVQQLNTPPEMLTDAERAKAELLLHRKAYAGMRPGAGNYPMTYGSWAAMRGPWTKRATKNHDATEKVEVKTWDFTRDGTFHVADHDSHEWFAFSSENVIFHEVTQDAFNYYATEADCHRKVKVIYFDHNVVNAQQQVIPFFKTKFDRERFLCQDYITQACVIHRSVLKKGNYKDRADVYEALLEYALSLHKVNHAHEVFWHVPETLTTEIELAPEAMPLRTMAYRDIVSRNVPDAIVEVRQDLPGCLEVKPQIMGAEPLVSIIIPTKGDPWILQPCISTVIAKTAYKNYEIILAVSHLESVEVITPPDFDRSRLTIVSVKELVQAEGFNWSTINNLIAKEHAKGEVYCFMNDDVRVLEDSWLRSMVAYASREDVGCVGAKLRTPFDTIQHIGVVSHNGINGHPHKGMHASLPGIHNIAAITHEVSAVTGACMVVEKSKFVTLQFDETFSHNFNDVDFCLRLRKKNLRIIADMAAHLQHAESASRPAANSDKGAQLLFKETVLFGKTWKEPDPYWPSSNQLMATPDRLGVIGLNYDLFDWPIRPNLSEKSVLVINEHPDKGPRTLDLMERNARVYSAEISDFSFRFLMPQVVNGNHYDIRQAKTIYEVLNILGIEEVYFCGLMPVNSSPAALHETLRFIRNLPVTWFYSAHDAQSVCPRVNMMTPEGFCNNGYEKGPDHCQSCIDRCGSPFGDISVRVYQAEWNTVASVNLQ